MKKLKDFMGKKYVFANMLASVALLTSTFIATRHCVFIYHQEKAPKILDLLRNE